MRLQCEFWNDTNVKLTPASAEEEVKRTQKNKATEGHLGRLKAKLARLRSQLLEPPKSGSGAKGEGFDVSKSGDARIALIG